MMSSACSADAARDDGETPDASASAWFGRTQFGFTVWPHAGETFAAALQRQASTLGPPQVVRYFYGPRALTWPPNDGFTGTTPLVLSFSRPPADVVAGRCDAEIAAFLVKLPRDRTTWVAYEHEMDAKVVAGSYTAPAVRAAFIRVAKLIKDTGNLLIRRTLILTGWDYRNRMRLYWPGATNVDVLGVDVYQWTNEGVVRLFDPPLAVAATYRKPLGIAEFGVWQGSDEQRAAFVVRALSHVRGKVAFVTYFNADRTDVPGDHDWEIDDLPLTSAAWRRLASL